MHELFSKIYDIWDSSVSKQVGNTAHILAYLFNSASRSCYNDWTLQFTFLHKFKDTFPDSEVCLHGYINWSLA